MFLLFIIFILGLITLILPNKALASKPNEKDDIALNNSIFFIILILSITIILKLANKNKKIQDYFISDLLKL